MRHPDLPASASLDEAITLCAQGHGIERTDAELAAVQLMRAFDLNERDLVEAIRNLSVQLMHSPRAFERASNA